MAFKDISGMKFGRLYVVGKSNKFYTRPNGARTMLWECKCDCGNVIFVRGDHMKTGNTLSCGECSNNTFEFIDDYCIVTCKNGDKFYIDKEDYPFVSKYSWSFDGRGYVVSYAGTNKLMKLHRILLNISDPYIFIDHIDHNPANNRRNNLRKCDNSQNNANRSLDSRNKSGRTGVLWDEHRQKWFAQIGWHNSNHFLGYYDDIESAIQARENAEKLYFKEYSYTNSINESGDDSKCNLYNQVLN